MPKVDGKGQDSPKGITPAESVDKNVRTDVPKGGAAHLEGPNAKNKSKGGNSY
jgi:hypothetical protein